jgi:hypothetical protein
VNPSAGVKVPSITGYVLAGLLTVAGIAAGVVLIVSGIRSYIDKVEGFERFDVPGSGELVLDDGGYSVYWERPGFDDDDPGPSLTVSIAPVDGGEPLDLDRYDVDVSYSVSGHDGRGMYTFSVDDPGRYRIRSDGTPGEVAVGRGIGSRFAGSLVAGVGTLLLAPVLGAIVALITFLRRSKAKRAARAWEQPQWGWTR